MDTSIYAVRSPREAVEILLCHRWKALGFFLLTLAGVGALLAVSPRSYVSEAKLFVRVGRESITLDPTATTGQTISVYESRESELNSVLDVIESRGILEQVVDKLGVATLLDNAASASGSPLERERAVQLLKNSLKVSHGKKSSVITVTAKAGSPQAAQQIVQTVLDAFQQQHLRINRTAGSYEFFADQERLLKTQSEQATRELRDAKNAGGLVSIDGQRRVIEDRFSAVEAMLVETEAALAASQATITAIRRAIDRLPERLVTQETVGFPNDAVDHTRQQFHALQIREQELLANYTERHPLVATVRQQLQQARQILQQQGDPSTQATHAPHPARQQFELNLMAEESNTAALLAKAESLRGQSARMQQRLRALNDQEGRIVALQHQVDLLQTNHRAYAEKLEQARIDQALEDQRISNVNVVQPATFVPKPAGPKKALIVALGLVVATIGSVGTAFGCEFLDRTLANRVEVVPEFSPALT